MDRRRRIGLLLAAAFAAATALIVVRFLPAREPAAEDSDAAEPGVRALAAARRAG